MSVAARVGCCISLLYAPGIDAIEIAFVADRQSSPKDFS
jgi:hypothetical protein